MTHAEAGYKQRHLLNFSVGKIFTLFFFTQDLEMIEFYLLKINLSMTNTVIVTYVLKKSILTFIREGYREEYKQYLTTAKTVRN
jgi:hypothetical protein